MLNLALHLVMRPDYSYKSIFKQIHTCKIFNTLNILGKCFFFFYSRLAVNRTGMQLKKTKALFQREVTG